MILIYFWNNIRTYFVNALGIPRKSLTKLAPQTLKFEHSALPLLISAVSFHPVSIGKIAPNLQPLRIKVSGQVYSTLQCFTFLSYLTSHIRLMGFFAVFVFSNCGVVICRPMIRWPFATDWFILSLSLSLQQYITVVCDHTFDDRNTCQWNICLLHYLPFPTLALSCHDSYELSPLIKTGPHFNM